VGAMSPRMRMVSVRVPILEHVPPMPFAGFWIRFLADFYDGCIALAIAIPCTFSLIDLCWVQLVFSGLKAGAIWVPPTLWRCGYSFSIT